MSDTLFTVGPAFGRSTSRTEAAAELGDLHRYYRPAPMADRELCTSPEQAADVLAPHFFGLDREACFAVHLDTKHRSLGVEMVSLGSADHTFMAPREVYRGALLANATALILAHNHPSGDHTPSRDDEQLTRRLNRAGELVGVDLLDHLVFGEDGTWTSLARRGVLA
jgi:DNA repair protein RadC